MLAITVEYVRGVGLPCDQDERRGGLAVVVHIENWLLVVDILVYVAVLFEPECANPPFLSVNQQLESFIKLSGSGHSLGPRLDTMVGDSSNVSYELDIISK